MSRQKGLTLIELMTTLAVAGLLTSIAVPALSNFSASSAQAAAVNDFVSSVHLARSNAISTNQRVTICASGSGDDCEPVSWNAGWIVFADTDGDRNVDPGETVLDIREGTAKLTMNSAQFDDHLILRPNGRALSASGNTSGEIVFCDDRGADRAKVVVIDLSGSPVAGPTMASGEIPSCPS